jgi:hypothetical protein
MQLLPWQFGGNPIPGVRTEDLPFKIQGAFFDCVSVAHHQDRDEAEHAPENDAALLNGVAVRDRPRVHEHDLDVEQDKKHRHQVKLHAEARLVFTLRDHAAFICGILGCRTFSAFAYQHTDNQRGSGEEDGYEDLQENWQIFAQHPEFLEPAGLGYFTPARWPFC